MIGDSGREGTTGLPDGSEERDSEHEVGEGNPVEGGLLEQLRPDVDEEGIPDADQRDGTEPGVEEGELQREIRERSPGDPDATVASGTRVEAGDPGISEDTTDGPDNTPREVSDVRIETTPSGGDEAQSGSTEGKLDESGTEDFEGFRVGGFGSEVRWRDS